MSWTRPPKMMSEGVKFARRGMVIGAANYNLEGGGDRGMGSTMSTECIELMMPGRDK